MIRNGRILQAALGATLLGSLATVSACSTAETLNQGYIVDEQTIALVPVGSSREQVMLALGSPSTTATFDNEVFYYISQKRVRTMAFMKPTLVEQRVLGIYFNKEGTVDRLANYGLQNGKVFDFISRTTPTGGKDASLLGQILQPGVPGAGAGAPSSIGSQEDRGIGPQR